MIHFPLTEGLSEEERGRTSHMSKSMLALATEQLMFYRFPKEDCSHVAARAFMVALVSALCAGSGDVEKRRAMLAALSVQGLATLDVLSEAGL